MYTINTIPIAHWGLRAGAIGSSLTGYALAGAWALPKRLGDTHRNWQGEVEPYVLADDLRFDGRDLTLRLACTAPSAQERCARLTAFKNDLPDYFTLGHPTLGSFEVGVSRVEVQFHGRLWGGLTLHLREPQPVLGTVLPSADGGAYGIDHRSWVSLGFVVEAIDGRAGLANWQPLSVTTDPLRDAWRPGGRSVQTLTIKGTVKGADYAQFQRRIEALQAIFSAPGLRTIGCADGDTIAGFCVDGFTIETHNFDPVHWGRFTCKMIVL